MNYRYLPGSGIKVSEICLGVMTFNAGRQSEVGSTDQPTADRMIISAREAGINFFDTADVYSNGASETMLGKALGKDRKDVVIATKVRFAMDSNPRRSGLSKRHILESCEQSLKRLGTDYIDLYQIHSYDPEVPLEETLEALDELVNSGKVRQIGCSNLTAWQTMKSLAVSDKLGFKKFITTQLYYSIGMRDIENEIVPLSLDQGMGILCWSPLSGGFFTGKYRKGQAPPREGRRNDRQARSLRYWEVDEERGFTILETLDLLALKYDKTVAQVALRWLLQKEGVTAVIIGARNPEQIIANSGASDWKLEEAAMQMLDKVSATRVPYPKSYQELE